MTFIAGRFAALVIAGEAALASVAFARNSFITIIAPILVIVVAGFFTLRSNVAKIWRENYEAEVAKAKALTAELGVAHTTITHQQGELSDVRTQLSIESNKHDLTPIMAQLDRQYDLLVELVKAIKNEPV